MSRTRPAALAAAAVATLALAACGGETSSGGSESTTDGGGSTESGPVTVEHAFGETTIEQKPERIATVAWANHEVPLALGVVPVGMAKAAYGDDDGDGILPWVEDKLEELGGEQPALFDETDSIDFEGVAATEPDVILAAYSGLTQEDYDTLSKIAPTVAFPDVPWGTSMDTMIEMNAKAMGMEAEGEQLVKDLDQTISETVAKYPDVAGKSAVFAFADPKDLSKIGYYNTNDPRASFLEDLKLQTPDFVTEAGQSSEAFYNEISAEKADQLADVDLVVAYGTEELLPTLREDKLIGKVPAIDQGAVAVLEDGTPLAASTNPSPLSIDWGLEKYLEILDQAAAKAQ